MSKQMLMKRLLGFLIFLFASFIIMAQSPAMFNYQAAVRDDNGEVLKEQLIGINISIQEESSTGITVYVENHSVVSSKHGVINLQIGNGQNQLGSLMDIDWANKEYWLEVQMDETGGSDYKFMSSVQLLSVPYALHAVTANNAQNATHAENSSQADLAFYANHASKADSADYVKNINVDDADADPTNELQTLNIQEDMLIISGGNTVQLPGQTAGLDEDPGNEIQDLSIEKNGNQVDLNISLGGEGGSFDVDDADADPENELQSLSYEDQTLSISNGNQIDLSGFGGPWKPSSAWDPYGIFYWGNVYMDTVDLKWKIHIGDSGAYGTEIYDRDMFMNDNIFGYDMAMNAERIRFQDSFYINQLSRRNHTLYQRINPELIVKRYLLSPDSVTMYNESEFRTVEYGTDKNLNYGYVNLFNGQGRKNLRLGSNFLPNYGSIPHTGGMQLFSYDSLTLRMESIQDGAFLEIYNKKRVPKLYLGTNEYENGSLFLNDWEGNNIISLSTDVQGVGKISTKGVIEVANSQGVLKGSLDESGLSIYNDFGHAVAGASKSFGGAQSGTLYCNDPNGYANFISGSNFLDDYAYGGFAGIYDNFGLIKAGMKVDFTSLGSFFGNEYKMKNINSYNRGLWYTDPDDDAGVFQLYGPNSELNVSMDYNVVNANWGEINIYNETGEAKAGLFIRPQTGMGELFADVKHFRMAHPVEKDKEIWYASLEGPEAGAYVRGTSKLVNGELFVEFPDHFKHVSVTEGMTVILTPLHWDTYGIAVVEKSENGFRVKELKGGQGNFEFDWEVKCVRKGFENYEVIKDKNRK